MSVIGDAPLSRQTWISAAYILVVTTVASKGLGLLRDVLVANFFGASPQVDAFVVASSLATLVVSIGSALSSTLVPTYRRALTERGPTGASQLAGATVSLALLINAVAILVLLFAPQALVELVAPSLPKDSARLAAELTRWLVGLVLGVNMIYIFTAIYNAVEHFRTPAVMDLASNVCVLLVLVATAAQLGIRALALGLDVGTLLVMTAMALPVFRRRLAVFNLQFQRAGVPHVLVLAGPVLLWEGLSQGGALVENFFGATLEPGSIAALGFAKRLSVVVMSLLAINIARAVFPAFSRLVTEGRITDTRELFAKILRQYTIIFVPLGIVMMYLGPEIVHAVYFRGAFDIEAAARTGVVFRYYAAATILLAAAPVCIRICYAFSDTLTPLVASAAGLVATAAFGALLTPRIGMAGIAIASGIAAAASVAIMMRVLARRMAGLDLGGLVTLVVISLGLSAISLVPVIILRRMVPGLDSAIPIVVVGTTIFGTGYIALGTLMIRREMRALWTLLRGGS